MKKHELQNPFPRHTSTAWKFKTSVDFSTVAIVSEVVYRLATYSIGKHPVTCIPYPLVLAAIYFSSVAICGLIYSANQVVSNQTPTFAEAWKFCKAKVWRVFWLYFLSIPLIMLVAFIPELLALSGISPLLARIIGMLVSFFITALFILCVCTVVLNDLEAGLALWTGFLILINNFVHVMVLNSIYLLLQILIMGALGNILFGIVVIAPFAVTMTLAYQIFVVKDSYYALSNIQPTA